MTWNTNRARSAVFQVCAMLLLRPDNVESEVLLLASAALFNTSAFASEAEFREFLKTALDWSDDYITSLIALVDTPAENAVDT